MIPLAHILDRLQSSSSFPRTAHKIREFRDLPQGWHYGRGAAPSKETIDAAIEIAVTALKGGQTDTDAIPGSNGEIQILVFRGSTYLEFTIEANGLVDYRREEGDNRVARLDALPIHRALSILEDFTREIWLSSGSSTASTTFTRRGALAGSHSKTTTAFPLLTGTVRSKSVIQYADT